MMAEPPLFWIKQISDSLSEVKEVPLWGFPPAFPLDALTKQIAELLHLPDLKISIENIQVRSSDETTSGLGAKPAIIALELTPLSQPLYWLMGQEDVRKLNAAALSLHNNSKGFSTPAFQEGFYRFLALDIAEAIDGLGAFKDLSLKIAAPQMPPAEEALCLDIALRSSKHTLWGRIVCPHAFRHAFKAHFSMTPASLSQSSLAKEVSITLRAEVGWTHLSLSRWKEVKVGDFILLDRCSYDPSTNKGTAALALNSTPLLHARLKGESMKIVDYAFYHEETMNENEHFSDEEEPTEPEGEEHLDNEEHLWSPLEKESSSEELISTQEIQLSLTVEVARLKINLDKLLQLRPGNVLELPVRPEQGVDISIGGKKIAKAELIKLGDLLGVKILQLGDQ